MSMTASASLSAQTASQSRTTTARHLSSALSRRNDRTFSPAGHSQWLPICAKAAERNGERNGARVQLWLSERRAVMFVEHDFDIIARYAPRVAFAQGTIIDEGASPVIGGAPAKSG